MNKEFETLYLEIFNLREEAQDCFWAFFGMLHKLYLDMEKNRMVPGSVPGKTISAQIDDYYIYTAGYQKKKKAVTERYVEVSARLEQLRKQGLNLTEEVFAKTAASQLAEVVNFQERIKKMAEEANKKV
jgi:hypothetical protein